VEEGVAMGFKVHLEKHRTNFLTTPSRISLPFNLCISLHDLKG